MRVLRQLGTHCSRCQRLVSKKQLPATRDQSDGGVMHREEGNVASDEGVTEMIPKPVKLNKKRARYVSRHRNKLWIDAGQSSSKDRSLGVPKVFLSPPSEYLKRRSRPEPCIRIEHVHPRRMEFRAKLPPRVPVANIVPDPLVTLPQNPVALGRINFRQRNVSNVKMLKPPERQPKYVDTRFGDKHNLSPSGLVPVYVYRKDYGKVPKAIKAMRAPRRIDDRHYIVASDKEQRRCSHVFCYPVAAEERQKLLDGMTKKRNETMEEFQCLPFLTDTLPKSERKTMLERELDALEKDIAFIECHPYMYIYDKCDDGDNHHEKITTNWRL